MAHAVEQPSSVNLATHHDHFNTKTLFSLQHPCCLGIPPPPPSHLPVVDKDDTVAVSCCRRMAPFTQIPAPPPTVTILGVRREQRLQRMRRRRPSPRLLQPTSAHGEVRRSRLQAVVK
jgi:hypothetical protein